MDTEKEEYRVYFERYEVSNFGNVRRKLKDGTYKRFYGTLNSKGYLRVSITPLNNTTQQQKSVNIHSMVAKCFLGERPSKNHTHIDHIDRNKQNNHVSNLKYTTPRENLRNKETYKQNISEKLLKNGTKKYVARIIHEKVRHQKIVATREEAIKWLKQFN